MDLETERLKLKLITVEDAEFLFELMTTEKWHQYIGDRGVHTLEDAENYIRTKMDPDIKNKGFINHVMIEKSTGEKVGTCSLHDREGVPGMDVGYALLPGFEGKGYATEGAGKMAKLAFDKYNQDKVYAITITENVGSIRVLENVGFEYVKDIQFPGGSDYIRLYSFSNPNS